MQISLVSSRVAHLTTLKVKNDGKAAAEQLTLCLPAAVHEAAAVLQARVAAEEGEPVLLKPLSEWAPPAGGPAAAVCADFALPAPLGKGKNAQVRLMAVLLKALRARPATVALGEAPRVVYEVDSAHVISPYAIARETAELQLGEKGLESHDAPAPAKLSGTTLKLGPYEDVAPFSAAPLRVHAEHSAAMLEAPLVERDVSVSGWGSVYFEDRYVLRNAGPALSTEFSRMELMTRPETERGASSAVAAVVPSAARDLYFRDEIGNISTSRVRAGKKDTMVRLSPRYPLYGGWTATFKFGWTMPLSALAGRSRDGSSLALRLDLAPAVKELVAERLVLRVVLPEGAWGAEAECALPHKATYSTQPAFLDLMGGRPVAVFEVANSVPEMKAEVVVTYRLSRMGQLQKPLLLAAGERGAGGCAL